MIVVEVGHEHQKYRIYKDLISYYSEYFRNALKEPWREAEDRVVELPDIEPQVFDIFVDWLYSQKVPEKNTHWVAPTENMKDNSTEHVQMAEILVIKTYVFADRFLVPTFRCAIYNHFAASLIKDCIPPYYEVIIFAFENLTEKSAMLDLLVGIHCAFWDESCDTESNGELELRKDLPTDFLLRVMIRSSKMKDKDKAKSLVECGCHNERPKAREGCESCRPEEKVEESKEEEAQADGQNQDDTTQANNGAAANASQVVNGDTNGVGADDETLDNDEAAADGTPTNNAAQVGDGPQPGGVEAGTEGTSSNTVNDGERANGAPQDSARAPANEPVQPSDVPEGGTIQVDGEQAADNPDQANDSTQNRDGSGTAQISNVTTEIATIATHINAVPQDEAVVEGNEAGPSNHEAVIPPGSQPNYETRTNVASTPAAVA
jgi:hypothetical protein